MFFFFQIPLYYFFKILFRIFTYSLCFKVINFKLVSKSFLLFDISSFSSQNIQLYIVSPLKRPERNRQQATCSSLSQNFFCSEPLIKWKLCAFTRPIFELHYTYSPALFLAGGEKEQVHISRSNEMWWHGNYVMQVTCMTLVEELSNTTHFPAISVYKCSSGSHALKETG